MAAVLIPCTRPGSWSAGNVFYQAAFSAPRESNTVEAVSQTRTRVAGTLSNLWFRMTANTCSAASTFKSRISGANGNISISVNASTTGTFQDSSNSDTIAATDLIDFDFTAGAGTGAFTIQGYAFLFAATTNTVLPCGALGTTDSTASNSFYSGPIGSTSALTVESAGKQEMQAAGTLKNLYVYVASNGRTTTSDVFTRVNGSDGAMSVSIGSAATGIFEDTTNTDSVSVGDEVSLRSRTGTGVGTIDFSSISLKIETTTSQFHVGSATAIAVSAGATTYRGLGAAANVDATTESNTSVKALTAFTLSRLWTNVFANATTSASTFDLRKNQTSTALTVSITAGTTGDFSDVTHTVDVLSTDELNVRYVNGGGGSLTPASWAALASAAGKLLPRLQSEGLFVGGVA